MAKKYRVDWKSAEQERLTGWIASGTHRGRKIKQARIRLKAADGWSDPPIRDSWDGRGATIERVRQRYGEEGLQQALVPRRTRRRYPPRRDGKPEAHRVALACSRPPQGDRRGSLGLLASERVRLEEIAEVSHGTVRTVMPANELQPGRKEEGGIPPRQNAEFVYPLEAGREG